MAETNLTKNREGYGYKYTDLAQIHNYLEENILRYTQFIQKIDGEDYVFTQKYILSEDGKKFIKDGEPLQGCRVVNAVLNGKSNPAQEQGSALTYARRYSLLMAYGLATEDDDAESLTQKHEKKQTKVDNLDEKITDKESKAIYAIMIRKGVDVQKDLKKNYNITNTNELTKRQYFSILNAMKKLPDKVKSEIEETKKDMMEAYYNANEDIGSR
jgi:hypothetical protein